MQRVQYVLAIATLTFLTIAQAALAQSIAQVPPPAPYVAASSILKLPGFISGVGSLYIDPADAPVGPWLAYGKDGRLVDILFMVPLRDFDAHKDFANLGATLLSKLAASGLRIDHVDITYNPGHVGMPEPHFHIRLSVLPHAEQVQDLSQ